MAKILGVGGIFLKTSDEVAYKRWYEDVLGFHFEDWGGAMFPHIEGRLTVWSAFPMTASHFEPSTAIVMINLLVEDLDGVLAKAAAAGVEPIGREDGDEHGRFAWLLDPAGIKLELWEPKAPQATS